ncbi:MAG: ankyrin repeat domain-containing protein [Bacteroidales bacterium]|nr:MAG: ankyrin repeat domain-containing protein [Bacteroidales bacterium]
MKFTIRIFVFLLGLYGMPNDLLSSGSDTMIFSEIKSGNQTAVKIFFRENNINGIYGTEKLTPLTFAIQENKYKMVKLLVKIGANVSHLCQDKSPLIYATKTNSIKIAKYLIKNGANVNDTTPRGNTALIYTAFWGQSDMTKYLVDLGADMNHLNAAEKTALDYAREFENKSVASYLRSLGARSEATYYPDYLDGPHIVWIGQDEAVQFYMKRDSAEDSTEPVTSTLTINDSPFYFYGLDDDTCEYFIRKEKTRPQFQVENVDRIIAIGDIHGGYDTLIQFLRNNQVIDQDLRWKWGDGHVVFLGDIFDRGEKVTESLWLIYKLEEQAKNAGGRIHLLLGNHELMAIAEMTEELAEKYNYMTDYLEINYTDFYSNDTEFGRWLRTKNIGIKIDDKLFVHGGISPEFTDMNITLADMNRYMEDFVENRIDSFNVEQIRFLLGELGPFWYRGYISKGETYRKIREPELDLILDHFDVSKIIVGHTNVKEISGYYSNKVYATDIPFYLPFVNFQALLIEDGKYYRLFGDGRRVLLE